MVVSYVYHIRITFKQYRSFITSYMQPCHIMCSTSYRNFSGFIFISSGRSLLNSVPTFGRFCPSPVRWNMRGEKSYPVGSLKFISTHLFPDWRWNSLDISENSISAMNSWLTQRKKWRTYKTSLLFTVRTTSLNSREIWSWDRNFQTHSWDTLHLI